VAGIIRVGANLRGLGSAEELIFTDVSAVAAVDIFMVNESGYYFGWGFLMHRNEHVSITLITNTNIFVPNVSL
jgi:hypothetical protein